MLKPLPAAKWNFTTAAHLLNRAGFGGPPAQIEALVRMGPDLAVAHFVDYEKVSDPAANPEWAKPDPERAERFRRFRQASEEARKEMRREEQRTQRERLLELRTWWLRRMAFGPRPLQEKLTLFWHGHFATSFQKVRDAYLMWRQNDTFRRLAGGHWPTLLLAMYKDPAMMLWLDQAQSKPEHPNENFARELMELFALGEGHYTEQDITEAARALTGWTLDRVNQEPVYRRRLQEVGVKTVLGRSGRLRGEEVIEHVATRPQGARHVMRKLWMFFASENPSEALIDALAAEFRRHSLNFKPMLRLIFRCEEFYDDSVIRTQVKSPVQWLVSSVRMLERDLPPPFLVNHALRLLGQELFLPPNVKGWEGGLTWITTNSLLNRSHLAALLVLGENTLPIASDRPLPAEMRRRRERLASQAVQPVALEQLLTTDQRRDKATLLAALERRFLQARLKDKHRAAIEAYLDSQGRLDDDDLRHAIRLLLCTPEFQLT
jgi:uncharacterized protein (DUF1800 family)